MSLASDASVKAALEPVELFEGVCEGGCEVGGRFAIQPVWLDQPSTPRRISEDASEVPNGLGVVVGALPTGSVPSCNRESSEPDIVDDHIWLRQTR